jgi:hypothetical protein
MKYIKITQEQNADLLSKHPYFNKSPLKELSGLKGLTSRVTKWSKLLGYLLS